MVVDILRLLVWLAGLALVAMIEHASGLPIVTLLILVSAVAGEPLAWYGAFVFLAAVLVAALFLESVFVIWILCAAVTTVWRSPVMKSRPTLLPRMALILLGAVMIAMLKQPTITISFIIHSLISMAVAAYVLWRQLKPRARSLDIAELRFISES